LIEEERQRQMDQMNNQKKPGKSNWIWLEEFMKASKISSICLKI